MTLVEFIQSHMGVTISIALFTSYLIFDIFMHEKMFETNESVALTLQSASNGFFDILFYTLSFFVYEQAVTLIFILFYMFYANKLQILKIMIYTSVATYTLSAVKMIYHDPRPYMAYERINGKGCDREFGNPSGHAFISSLFYLILWETFKSRKFEFNPTRTSSIIRSPISSGEPVLTTEESNSEERQRKFRCLLAGAALFIFGIGLSRVYLGVHSYNQIMLGYAFGFFSLSLYFLLFEDILDTFLTKLTYKMFNDKRDYYNHIAILAIIFAILVGISIIIFEILNANFQVPELWIKNILQDCNQYLYYKSMHYKCLMDTGIISTAFGVFFGLLLTEGDYEPERFETEFVKLSFGIKIYRLIVMIIPLGVIFIVIEVIPMGENIYALFFVKYLLRLFLLSFLLVKAMPFLFFRFKVDIEGDFLKYPKKPLMNYKEDNKDQGVAISLLREEGDL